MSRITPITVPQWGLEMTEGVISQWHVAVGDSITQGTEIVDIETAKIVNTLEASSSMPGVIRRLVGEAGETLPVGAVIAVLAESSVPDAEIDAWLAGQGIGTAGVSAADDQAEEVAAIPQPESTSAPAPAPAPAPEEQPAAVATPARSALGAEQLAASNAEINASPVARRLANRLGIELAGLSGSGRHGRISVEDVQAAGGNAPAPVSPLAAPDAAQLEAINAAVSASPVARRLANRHAIDLRRLRGTGRHGRVSVADVESLLDLKPESPACAATQVAQGAVRAGPAARRMAAELGIDLAALEASGPRNLVLKDDVRNAFRDALVSQEGEAAVEYEDIALTPMRKAIAASLVQSKQTIPHFYLTADLRMDALIALREQMNSQPRAPRKLSLNDFLLRATALALRDVPDANVHFTDAGIRRFNAVHLSLAVAIEGGLVTPVLRHASEKGVYALSEEARQLADKARSRSLSQAQISGGTFTVSNLGMFGIRQFDAVINPPQGAILAVGNVRREAVETEQGEVRFQSVMSVTMSCDHRVIDGAVGAQFLAALREHIESPFGLLS